MRGRATEVAGGRGQSFWTAYSWSKTEMRMRGAYHKSCRGAGLVLLDGILLQQDGDEGGGGNGDEGTYDTGKGCS